MEPDHDEVVLKGGRANTGNVVRIGQQVARPCYPQTETVAHFLRYLIETGADFVPTPLGFDDQDRHRLRYLPGTAPTPPYPSWAFNEKLLIDVAQHQRTLHHLARNYEPPPDAQWAVSAGDYFPPDALAGETIIVCHNDLGMTNTIVDEDHRLTGFIDFDYCKPVDPLFDIAVAIRHWAPFGDLDIESTTEIDRIGRFALFCDVHELATVERRRVVSLAIDFLDHARNNIKALAAAGGAGFQALLDDGYEATNLATVQWLHSNATILGTHGA